MPRPTVVRSGWRGAEGGHAAGRWGLGLTWNREAREGTRLAAGRILDRQIQPSRRP